jgi:inorganic pyrophosphatase
MIPQQETQAIRSAGFDSSNESNRAATFRSILINGDVDACDAKIIAYATGNPRYVELQNFTDIRPNIHREIEHFLRSIWISKASKPKFSDGKTATRHTR